MNCLDCKAHTILMPHIDTGVRVELDFTPTESGTALIVGGKYILADELLTAEQIHAVKGTVPFYSIHSETCLAHQTRRN